MSIRGLSLATLLVMFSLTIGADETAPPMPFSDTIDTIDVKLFDHPLRELFGDSAFGDVEFSAQRDDFARILKQISNDFSKDPGTPKIIKEIGRIIMTNKGKEKETVILYWSGGKGPMWISHKETMYIQSTWKKDANGDYPDGAVAFDGFLRRLAPSGAINRPGIQSGK